MRMIHTAYSALMQVAYAPLESRMTLHVKVTSNSTRYSLRASPWQTGERSVRRKTAESSLSIPLHKGRSIVHRQISKVWIPQIRLLLQVYHPSLQELRATRTESASRRTANLHAAMCAVSHSFGASVGRLNGRILCDD